MATIQKQVRMVFDLNKCLGCQACTMACKTMWTDRDTGSMYMYWNNVESQPGRGYPKNWFTPGATGNAGFGGCVTGTGPGGAVTYNDLRNAVQTGIKTVNPDGSAVDNNPLKPINSDYGAPWEYNYCQVLKTEGGDATSQYLAPSPPPNSENAYSMNWDEDVGEGVMPNAYYFYVPRICNHCTKPACVAACPRQAPYKREEDGIVLIDQDRCLGYRYCVKGCPYKKSYYNPELEQSQKCIFCYPRLEDPKGFLTGRHSFCFTQCVGRIRHAGFLNPNEPWDSPFNKKFNVNLLVYKYKVALRLHPEFGTEPNLFYIPPLSAPTFDSTGRSTGRQRIPIEVLAGLFGDSCNQTLADRVNRIKEIFIKLQLARTGALPELQEILIAHSETDRLQLDKAFTA